MTATQLAALLLIALALVWAAMWFARRWREEQARIDCIIAEHNTKQPKK